MNRLPEKWQDVKISDLALSHKGAIKIGPFGSQLKQDEMVSEGIRVLGQENIIANNFKLGKRYISIAKFQQLKSCQVFPGDVLVSMMGTIGLSRIVPDGFETAIMDSHLIRIQVNPNIVDKDYFCKVLHEYEGVKAQINRNSQGGIMSGLNSQIINSLSIIVPPLPEQRKIAAVLSSADQSIAVTEKLIAKLADLKKALMQQLLTKGIGHTKFKPSPLGPIPKSWEVALGRDILILGAGPSPSAVIFSSRGDVLYIKVDDFNTVGNEDYITKSKLTFSVSENPGVNLFDKGALVIAKRGAAIFQNRIRQLIRPTSIDTNLMTIQCHSTINERFLKYYLENLKLEKLADTTSIPQINNFHLYESFFPLPPVPEQWKIADILNGADRKLSAAKVKLAKAKDLKQGLMNDLLTGKVRVNYITDPKDNHML